MSFVPGAISVLILNHIVNGIWILMVYLISTVQPTMQDIIRQKYSLESYWRKKYKSYWKFRHRQINIKSVITDFLVKVVSLVVELLFKIQ